jgi:hypothetical protein
MISGGRRQDNAGRQAIQKRYAAKFLTPEIAFNRTPKNETDPSSELKDGGRRYYLQGGSAGRG